MGGYRQLLDAVEPSARLLRTWKTSGLSNDMTGAEVERPDGSIRRYAVRRAVRDDRTRGALSIGDEFRLLKSLRLAGLPVPAPRILNRAVAVYDWLEGTPRFSTLEAVATGQAFAAQLAAIHRVDSERLIPLRDRTAMVGERLASWPVRLDDRLQEGLIRAALRRHWPPALALGRPSLLHGDFWPGNVLWQHDKIVGVVDWEDTTLGDPLSDVGITRLDLLWAFGPPAMSAFTERYRALTGSDLAALPLWDLSAALRPTGQLSSWADWSRFGRSDVTETSLADAHRWFVNSALDALERTTG